MTTILITGGRGYNDRHHLRATLDAILLPQPLTGDPASWFPAGDMLLVHGAAPGADRLAGAWAEANFCGCRAYPVIPTLDGPWPYAGPRRNLRMFNDAKPALVLAFPGEKGTSNMIGIALRAGCHTFGVQDRAPLSREIIAQCRKIMRSDER